MIIKNLGRRREQSSELYSYPFVPYLTLAYNIRILQSKGENHG